MSDSRNVPTVQHRRSPRKRVQCSVPVLRMSGLEDVLPKMVGHKAKLGRLSIAEQRIVDPDVDPALERRRRDDGGLAGEGRVVDATQIRGPEYCAHVSNQAFSRRWGGLKQLAMEPERWIRMHGDRVLDT